METRLEIKDFPLDKVETLNWLLLLAMAVISLMAAPHFFTRGIVVGGLIANLSFIVLKRDLFGIMAGPLKIAKVSFFIKYYVRLTILAVVLFFLVRYQLVGIFGLLVGLSTVVLSILCTTAGLVAQNYSTSKEAV